MQADSTSGQPVRNAMSDRVYTLLRSRIIDLDLAPGARLQIDQFSAEFDVSPTPVREALNRLVAEGLVTAEPYRGFKVTALLDHDELVQLLRAREALETAAAAHAAIVRDQGTLERLDAVVQRMDELANARELEVKAFNAADAQFHRLVVEASGNRFMVHAFDSLHAHVQISRHYQGRSVEEARCSNDEHRSLLDAITRSAGSEAADHVRAHLHGVLERLKTDHWAERDGDAS